MMYALILAGLVLLFLGGELLVRGSVGLARRFGLSELVIGLVLVGFGTSAPELVTTLQGVTSGATGIAVGNVVGSNIANVLLILGVAALLSPFMTNPGALARDLIVMIGLTGVFAVLVWLDLFTRITGIALVGFLLAYIVISLVLDRRAGSQPGQMHAEEGELLAASTNPLIAILFALLGLAGVIFGARFLVTGGVELAEAIGLSQAVIGLTIVAIGTSLPELATAIVAAARGKSDVAIGNVIGSNIFNIAGILGIAAIVKPFTMLAPQPAATSILETRADPQGVANLPILGWTDMGALFLSVVLMVLFALTGRRMARWEGLVLLAAYLVYLGLMFEYIPTPFS